jgi:exonuclease SbcD
VQATLTDPRRPLHAMERLRSRFPHALLLAFEPEGVPRTRGPVLPRVDGRSDLDVALGFVAEVRELEATTEEALLLQLACDSCRVNEDADRPVEVGEAG